MIKILGVAKFVAALVGAACTAAAGLTLPDDWAPWITILSAAATAAAVYQIPNRSATIATADAVVVAEPHDE